MTRRTLTIGVAGVVGLLAVAECVFFGIARGHRLLDAAETGQVAPIQAAIDHEPTDAGLWHLLGQAYASKSDYSSAVKAYERSVQLNPRDEDTWWMLGIAQVCRKDAAGVSAVQTALNRLNRTSAAEYSRLAPLGCCAFGGC